MKLYELIAVNEYIEWHAPTETDINNITADPRKAKCDTLLIITNSRKITTLNYINEECVILTDESIPLPDGVQYVRAKNVRLVAAYACSRFYHFDSLGLKIIGVTGTNGKTSTATFIKHALEGGGIPTGFIGTGMITACDEIISDTSYSMTTPDPWDLYRILAIMQTRGCRAVVMEVSSHALELCKVAPISFEYAVFTNLSPEHLDFHKSYESYYLAKKRLFGQCKTAIINVDDPMARRLADECNCRMIKVGAVWRGDHYASRIRCRGENGVDYLYHGNNFVFEMKLMTPGIYNVYNSMLSIAVAVDMGVKPVDVKKALSCIRAIPGRYEIIKDDVTVIIDYAHTSGALEAFLQSVRRTMTGVERLITVFGAGGERDREKRPRMAAISERYSDLTVITSDNPRGEDPEAIISDIVSGFTTAEYRVIADREAAIRESILCAGVGDTVAVIGKGCEGYYIDRDGYHPFDEYKIINGALLERKKQVVL